MKTKKLFNPSPKVSVSENTTTLSHAISYEYSDLELRSLILTKFTICAKQRFPQLSHEDECVCMKVAIKLPNDHQLPSDATEETCDLTSAIVGKCLLIVDKDIGVGFQKELSSKEEIPHVMAHTTELIQALSSDPDTMRGMKIQISMFKKLKISAWAFE